MTNQGIVKDQVDKLNQFIQKKANYVTSIGDGFDDIIENIIDAAQKDYLDKLGYYTKLILRIGQVMDKLVDEGFKAQETPYNFVVMVKNGYGVAFNIGYCRINSVNKTIDDPLCHYDDNFPQNLFHKLKELKIIGI